MLSFIYKEFFKLRRFLVMHFFCPVLANKLLCVNYIDTMYRIRGQRTSFIINL